MFADITGYPIEPADIGEAGALGCAMAAAVAVGDCKDFSEAEEKMLKLSKTVYPNPDNQKAYESRYNLYKQIIEALDPIWDDMQRLAEIR
jgi:L-xylulokinase